MYTVATTISTICGNFFTQHIPLHIPRRSLNKPKPIPDYSAHAELAKDDLYVRLPPTKSRYKLVVRHLK